MTRWLFLIALVISQTGCETVSYYHQAAKGQLALMINTRDVNEVIDDVNTPAGLKNKLRLTQNVLAFAQQRGLDVDGSYQRYVALDRTHVVWNVFVTPQQSLRLEQWCYPIAGCVSYKGFFAREDADQFATKMQLEGKQSYVGGVAAYSTLGWFNDPLLSTFIGRDDLDLAALLFHELSHKVIYVADDTVFNESFATAAEQILLSDWLNQNENGGAFEHFAIDAEHLSQHLLNQRRRSEVIGLIVEVKNTLSLEFSKETDGEQKQRAAEAIFSQLRDRYQLLSMQWGETRPFEYWMTSDINNPKIAAIGAYSQWVPAFLALYDESVETNQASRWANFAEQTDALAKQPKAQRDETLATLASKYKPE